jgi:hypothetical protein
MNFKNWWKDFPGERFLARILVVNNLFLLMPAIREVNRPLVAYCFLRIFIYIVAEVVYFIRRRRDFYLPFIRELSDSAYWSAIILLLFLIKLLFLDKFIGSSSWSQAFSLIMNSVKLLPRGFEG